MEVVMNTIANLGAALRRYGKVNCRRCDARSATTDLSEEPFSDGYRVVYRCHGDFDFRVDPLMPATHGAAYPKMSAGARMQRRMGL